MRYIYRSQENYVLNFSIEKFYCRMTQHFIYPDTFINALIPSQLRKNITGLSSTAGSRMSFRYGIDEHFSHDEWFRKRDRRLPMRSRLCLLRFPVDCFFVYIHDDTVRPGFSGLVTRKEHTKLRTRKLFSPTTSAFSSLVTTSSSLRSQ